MKKKLLIISIITGLTSLLLSTSGFGAERYGATTSISYGAYQTTDGENTLNGSQLAISFMSHFAEQWSYFIRLGNGSANGTHTENGTSYDLKSNTTTLTGGIHWSYELDLNSDNQEDLTPYIGTGISAQKYEYDFEYPDSKVGKTSGTGYGPFITLGLKVSLSTNIVLIPGYHYEQINIKTEDGSDRSFTSSGISLAFVARF